MSSGTCKTRSIQKYILCRVDDLRDVAEEVKKNLTIHPVEEIAEVLNQLGIKVPAPILQVV